MTTIESFFSLFPLQSAPANTTASFVGSLIPFLLVIGIFYFLIIRPQNKKQKETEKMLASLKKGDKVVTIGGVHGIIHAVKDTTVVLKVDDATKIEFSRNAIASVLEAAKASSDETVTEEKK
ncbi:MAG: preprotein translocase subunit YajC [Treponemataceae bacterium]|jgi:preprotein translocase subunit YajC|uniref:preprotein translocase subunit YajC n=1 Tax=Treponema sp. J25 TaxID=2094121 RepID=UPI001043BD24|nr:preprotein translocase subunit YajC [Treponema sp. J25]MCX7949023.1 preprotein translocase subunit YajC [Treponemataceae bacterium]TCW61263.1 preprotein translocase subunit YajC [Treponema sp. J25]